MLHYRILDDIFKANIASGVADIVAVGRRWFWCVWEGITFSSRAAEGSVLFGVGGDVPSFNCRGIDTIDFAGRDFISACFGRSCHSAILTMNDYYVFMQQLFAEALQPPIKRVITDSEQACHTASVAHPMSRHSCVKTTTGFSQE